MQGPEILFVALVCWAVGLITFIVMRGLGWKHREKQLEARQAEQAVPQLPGPTLDQFQMLEDRMRVIEKIVTDPGYTLADDIEALRDTKPRRTKEVL